MKGQHNIKCKLDPEWCDKDCDTCNKLSGSIKKVGVVIKCSANAICSGATRRMHIWLSIDDNPKDYEGATLALKCSSPGCGVMIVPA